ncbi:MAG TPA: insulinase family protein [Vicinamibacterales bacterium]
MASAQTRDWPSERPPRSLPARDIKFPPYEIQTLPNGLQVVAVLHHEQPAVSMRMIVGTGSASDPKGKLGLAHLVASLLDQGTTSTSAKQMNDAIDSIGGAMGAGAASDLSFVNMVVMKDSFEPGLRMLADMVEHPAFSAEEIDRQRQQSLSFLRVSLDDPEYLANAVFDRLVYGFNGYGMPDGGTPATMAGITRNDLLGFHQRYFAPNNAILAIVGDVTAEEAFDTVKKVFSDWKSREVPRERFVEPPNSARRVIVIDKPDAVQTEIRVGNIGVPRSHSDYMALNLAIRILGGEGSNRLHQVLRTDRGLTYGAQADMNTLKESGDFVAETNTRSDATGEVVRLIVDEMWRLQRERVSEAELAAAKAYLTGSFPLTIETPDSIALQVLNVMFYGLPLEQLQTFRERVNRVTVDDIERVARFYLKPDAVSVVLVGNASVFTPQLRGVGFGRYETIPIEELDLLTTDFKKGGPAGRIGRAEAPVPPARPAPPAPPARPAFPALVFASYQQPERAVVVEEGAKAKALLDQVIAAKGGLATLRGIKSIKAVTAATMASPDGGGASLEAETTTYLQYPNHVRVETKAPQGEQIQIYDGERGWVRDPGGVHDVPGAALEDMAASLKRDTVAALLAADRGELRARLLPDVKDTDGAVRHALELSSPSFEPLVLYIDPRTSLITKQAYVVRAPGQPLIEELFSDYRPVDGVNVAFTAEVRAAGKPIVKRRLNQITFNAALDPRLFTRPVN